MSNDANPSWHRKALEHRSALFAVLVTVGISIGGLVEIVPMYNIETGPETLEGVEPYTPLELVGRDIYVSEGCYNCHSQWVRPFRSETLRYGPWSRAGEYAYDHPFQLGSRRIGPDLMRVGKKYPDAWHWEHMRDPRSTSPGSIMPPYPWLYEKTWSVEDAQASMRAMQTLGVPYSDADIEGAGESMQRQSQEIVASLAKAGAKAQGDEQVVALIAYLQRLGTDGRAAIEAQEAAQ